MRICFILGSPDISGGTYVIFQHALFLQKHCQCQVDVVSIFSATNENTAWHPEARDHLHFLNFEEASGKTYDIAIATWWKTIFEVQRINAGRYIYFVQSIESLFYPADEIPLRRLVDSTYEHGLPVITEASWIRNYLYVNYSAKSWIVRNGIRKDLYKNYGDHEGRNGNKLRVLVEGPVDVLFKNVPRTIDLCRRAGISDIWLLTSSDITKWNGVNRVFSKVPITKTPYIYRSCDVIIKLSYVEGMFGPPLEMFHCGGTAIVYNVTGHDEYIRHNINGLVAEKGEEKCVIDFMTMLQKDAKKLNELKFEARRTASGWPDWDTSSFAFYNSLVSINRTVPAPDRHYLFGNINENFRDYVREEEKLKSGQLI